MRLPEFTRRKILSITVVGCLTLLAAQNYGSALLDRIFVSTRRDITNTEQRISHEMNLLSQRPNIEQRSKEIRERFGQKVPDQEWIAQTLSAVNTLAQSGKIQLQELNSGSIERKDGIHSFKLRASLKGDWPSLLEFFNSAQQAPYRFDIEELSLEKFPADPQLLRCQVTLSRWAIAQEAP